MANAPANAVPATTPTAASAGTSIASPTAPAIALNTAPATSSGAKSVDDRFAEGDCDGMSPGVCLELGEDVPDVALHRLLADEEPGGDVGVRHAVSEQLQDLALALGQHLLPLAREESGHEGGVHVALPTGHLLDGAEERLMRRFLEDVALGARFQAAAEQAALAVGREDEHRGLRQPLAQDLCSLEPIHAGHAYVHDHHVGTPSFRYRDGAGAVGCFADHANLRCARQRETKALSDDLVVVGN